MHYMHTMLIEKEEGVNLLGFKSQMVVSAWNPWSSGRATNALIQQAMFLHSSFKF